MQLDRLVGRDGHLSRAPLFAWESVRTCTILPNGLSMYCVKIWIVDHYAILHYTIPELVGWINKEEG
jgi:hypothetical protein